MTNQHPITPSPELVEQWVRMLEYLPDKQVFSKVAQWGADQELDACCEWLQHDYPNIGANALRATRRPKSPTLKEQALAELDDAVMRGDCITISDALPTLRRAIEALPND